ncbi:triacylglycerol lipase [Allokutzneria sp. NRRL B-24872]|uniref:esterase/lipase family protein n=1 Tax=Allokutzneria sp. NRRL B-24872 TaxID=1137961 RepID=UPI001FEECC45|nr:alpha/beta fold hydrolase [Allokutzneria sp. NRRL B-24872]
MGKIARSDVHELGEHLLGHARRAAAVAETAKAVGEGVGVVLRGMASLGGLRGAAVEATWLAAHAVLYPWGALAEKLRPGGHYERYRTDDLAPSQRGLVVSNLEGAGTPVVLVHGIGDNRSIFTVLSGALRRRGFGVVHAVNYSILTAVTGDIRSAAAELGAHIERVCEETGSDSVHVVGHSLGGIIARYYVQRQGGDERVRTLITLGTPHTGTLSAYLLPTKLVRELRPGSELMTELAEPAPGCRTRFVVVWSELDEVVIPQVNARLRHPDLDVEEHCLRDVGHLSLPIARRCVHAVLGTLTQVKYRRPTRSHVACDLDHTTENTLRYRSGSHSSA